MFRFANKQRYSELSDKELLTSFRSENWSKSKPNQRVSILQEVENRNAAVQGRPPCRVSSFNAKGKYGRYSPSSNEIKVNVNDYIRGTNGPKKNNSYQVLDTIYHEGEHAHQTNCVNNQIGPPQGLPKTTRDMCEIENSRKVYDGLISYKNCTKELDSNNVAAKRVMESKELFQDDPEYGEYLKDRDKYFEDVANRNMIEVYMQQSDAVEHAYKSGKIDLKRHDDILINGVNKPQPVFEEAKEISKNIKKERLKNEQNYFKDVDEPEVENQQTIDQSDEVETVECDNSEDEGLDVEEEQGYRRR